MKESIIQEKSLNFAIQIIKFYENYSKTHKDNTLSKQLLRSGTSIGANISEAMYGNSKADFISKLHISLKECSETIYWVTLLRRTELASEVEIKVLLENAEEIKRITYSVN